jgi:hypothetical protein
MVGGPELIRTLQLSLGALVALFVVPATASAQVNSPCPSPQYPGPIYCPTPPPPPPPACTPKFTSKLSIARVSTVGGDLDVLAPITSRASGRANVEYHAAGRRTRFTAPVNSVDGRIRFERALPAAQAALGTGILTLSYPGDADTRPQVVRLRGARNKANLDLARPRIINNRIRASGTVNERARGVVRLQLEYQFGCVVRILKFRGRIADGRWSINEALTTTQRAEIALRTGTVHSYTLFTGYFVRRIRGEMRAFQVLGGR